MSIAIRNPYAQVNFATAMQIKSDLHSHTIHSDGRDGATVKARVDNHKARGFQLLALTDHDTLGTYYGGWVQSPYRPYPTWPISAFYNVLPDSAALPFAATTPEVEPSVVTAGENVEYYPNLGMLFVKGAEPTGWRSEIVSGNFPSGAESIHHMQSLFNPLWSAEDVAAGYIAPANHWFGDTGTKRNDVDWRIAATQSRGGYSILNHPGYHWDKFVDGLLVDGVSVSKPGGVYPDLDDTNTDYPYPTDWYVALLKQYPNLLGIEVIGVPFVTETKPWYGQWRHWWDTILSKAIRYRDIWGFCNSDVHAITGSSDYTGVCMNMLLVDSDTLANITPADIETAISDGKFYIIWDPLGNTVSRHLPTPAFPLISNIAIDTTAKTITITAANATAYRWIFEGKNIARGNVLNYGNKDCPYVRCEIDGADGSLALTQAFALAEAE